MPIFSVIIVNGNIFKATEEFSSMIVARNAVMRSALQMLLAEETSESRRVADCRIVEVGSRREASFKISLDITD
ncbi:hypothetical protein FHS97_002657 [Sphingomonas endophytica]|uniref:Uncharacterized protein n=1 Tax=Sphingomonas endophytica TaxID=869719 RepID=A0ABR6N7C9_9SPHN|nr:hypothetical protein [Sphingomonas endophytica]MBB5726709.1 hypothetical protein [Sphingomonas endophytica]